MKKWMHFGKVRKQKLKILNSRKLFKFLKSFQLEIRDTRLKSSQQTIFKFQDSSNQKRFYFMLNFVFIFFKK